MTSVSVIIPFWGDDLDRLAALQWVSLKLQSLDFSVVVAQPSNEGPFSKGAVLWPAIRRSDADIFVLHDADVYCNGLSEAIDAVSSGQAVWARPHDRVWRLSEASSGLFRASDDQIPHLASLKILRSPYRGITGGGIVVLRREVALNIPIDPRFVGWGQEDMAFGEALWCLSAAPWIGLAPLIHFWHEPEARLNPKWGSLENRKLYERYHRAIADPSQMQALVAEAHDALTITDSEHSNSYTVV